MFVDTSPFNDLTFLKIERNENSNFPNQEQILELSKSQNFQKKDQFSDVPF
jgi:hypothetical protein